MKLTLLLCSSAALAALLAGARFASAAGAPRDSASLCNPRPPLSISMRSLEAEEDPLSTNVVGLVAVHVGAATDLTGSTVKVSCTTSEGLTIEHGPADFTDGGSGMDLMLEKLEPSAQWLLVRASVTRADGERFDHYRFFGAVPQPALPGTFERDRAIYVIGEQL